MAFSWTVKEPPETSLRTMLLTSLVARGKQGGQRSGTSVRIQELNSLPSLGSENSHGKQPERCFQGTCKKVVHCSWRRWTCLISTEYMCLAESEPSVDAQLAFPGNTTGCVDNTGSSVIGRDTPSFLSESVSTDVLAVGYESSVPFPAFLSCHSLGMLECRVHLVWRGDYGNHFRGKLGLKVAGTREAGGPEDIVLLPPVLAIPESCFSQGPGCDSLVQMWAAAGCWRACLGSHLSHVDRASEMTLAEITMMVITAPQPFP